MTTNCDILTESTWICRDCGAQQTYKGVTAQMDAAVGAVQHSLNKHGDR